MTREYGQRGFVPTVDSHTRDGGDLILHTTDSRQETDLVLGPDGIHRVGDLVTDEQQEVLGLYERN